MLQKKFEMLLVFFIAVVQVISVNCDGLAGEVWNYQNKGPDYWPVLFKKCKAQHQSPINIIPSKTVYSAKLKPVKVQNSNNLLQYSVVDTGETVKFVPSANQARIIFSGSDFQGEYFYLQQFHFHWGWNDYQGSEHQINYVKYAAEVHLVTQSLSGNFAVFGFLFKLSANDNPKIATIMADVGKETGYTAKANVTTQSTFKLSDFLPNSYPWHKYYRYSGSLTTPPCTEAITWTVFTTPIAISHNQLNNFRNASTPTNFRDVQNPFARIVKRSF